MFETSILLQTSDKEGNTTQIEPLPNLDYHLLYTLIQLARPYLPKRDLKRFDYLADARKLYYQCHYKFQSAFRALQDLSSQSDMLDTRHASLTHSQNLPLTDGQNTAAPTLTEELHILTVRRRTNEQETRAALAEVKKRKEGMERACGWFSSLKWRFLNTEVGVLVEVGKQVYAYKNGNRCMEPPKVGPLPDVPDVFLTARGFLLEGEFRGGDVAKEGDLEKGEDIAPNTAEGAGATALQ
ncbi:hypothetical protein OEA41_006401 [Lepraria neglecta]|uniref:Uncharacterized protein n=1 Tax=Lepraria neglecta TaxID=209136 RepID=A0AAD9ZA89_9LECA|nr:hypothetical protein OEA41_006401 [Lepraria neglecta]